MAANPMIDVVLDMTLRRAYDLLDDLRHVGAITHEQRLTEQRKLLDLAHLLVGVGPVLEEA